MYTYVYILFRMLRGQDIVRGHWVFQGRETRSQWHKYLKGKTGRVKWSRDWNDRIEEGICGGITNTKELSEGHVEIYYCRHYCTGIQIYKEFK